MLHEISEGHPPLLTERVWQSVPQSVACPFEPELSVPVDWPELPVDDVELQVHLAPFQPSPYESPIVSV